MLTGADVLINGINIFKQYNIRCVSLNTSTEHDFMFNRSVESRRNRLFNVINETFSVTMSFAKVKENSQHGSIEFEDCDYETLLDLFAKKHIVEVEKNNRIYYLSPTIGRINRRFGVVTFEFDSISSYIHSPIITQEYVGSNAKFEINNDGLEMIDCDLTIEGKGKVTISNDVNGISLSFNVDGSVKILGDSREIDIDDVYVNDVLECDKGHTTITIECDADITSTIKYQVKYGVGYQWH